VRRTRTRFEIAACATAEAKFSRNHGPLPARVIDKPERHTNLAYVVVSADTDDQGGRSRARITDLRPRAAPSD